MKDYGFNKAIENFKKIKMSDQEKSLMKRRVMESSPEHVHTGNAHKKAVPSPWTLYSFRVWIEQWPAVITILVLIFIAGSTGIVSAAEFSLPGDALYSIKVGVTEPIRDVLAVSAESQAKWQATKVERRLEEATILASEGKLDEKIEKVIEDKLDKHAKDFASAIDRVVKDGDDDKADEISVAFQANVGARTQALEIVADNQINNKSGNRDKKSSVATIARNDARTVHDKRDLLRNKFDGKDMLATDTTSSMSVMKTELATSTPIPQVAARITIVSTSSKSLASSTTSNKQRNKNIDSYKRSKESAEKFIESTSKKIEKFSTSTDNIREMILNSASTTLEEARKSLIDASNSSGEGDDDNAYSQILESERAAKESSILFDQSIKAQKRDNARVRGESSNKKR